jgi:hypothetical protein
LGWGAVIALVTLGFVGMGARSYAVDVAFIESEMVDTAKWVDANIPADALIAAHDIGALGYFDRHRLIDLAGLVSPEVIPFLRDETQLADYLNQRGVGYLIAFPRLYPTLAGRSELAFITNAKYATMLGGENMAVYRWTR